MTTRTVAGLLIVALGSVLLAAAARAADEPDASAKPPQGAVILFDGKDTSQWQMRNGGGPCEWKVLDDGSMESQGGDIVSKPKFQDFKAHVEFWVPNLPSHVHGQGRGNSGVYLQSRYEIQVLDSYRLPPTKNDCGAIYDQKAPDVNACRPPEQWQSYDITFRAARFDKSGKKIQNARVSVMQNGQQIHKDAEITGSTGAGDPESPEPGPLMLQYHGNKVRYRNIWVVPTGASAVNSAGRAGGAGGAAVTDKDKGSEPTPNKDTK